MGFTLPHWRRHLSCLLGGLSVINEESDTCLSEEKSIPFYVSMTGKIKFTRGMCQSLAMDFEGSWRVHIGILKTGWGFVPYVPDSTYLILPISSGGIPQRGRGVHPLQLLLHETAGSRAANVIHWFTGQLLCSAVFIPNSLLSPWGSPVSLLTLP